MSINYQKLKKQPYNFLQLSGLQAAEFDLAVDKIPDSWEKIESKTWQDFTVTNY